MRWLASLLLLPVWLAPVQREGRRLAGEGAPFPGGPTELAAIRSRPGRFLGAEVRFALQLSRSVEDWNPFLSRFGPREWLALEAWPDERFTWDQEVFENPATRLFVRRGSPPAELVRRSRPHARLEARGRVREVFLGEPWIEIEELVPMEGEVGEGTILHVGRARELLAEGQWTLALEQYERAKAAPLPPHALAAIEREILATRLAQKREARERGKKPDRRAD